MARTHAASPVPKMPEVRRVCCMSVTAVTMVTGRMLSVFELGWGAGPYAFEHRGSPQGDVQGDVGTVETYEEQAFGAFYLTPG